MSRRTILSVVLVLLLAAPVHAFSPGMTHPTGSTAACPQKNRWAASGFPVIWHMNPSLGPRIHGDSAAVGVMLEASFATWTSAPNTVLMAQRGADTTLRDPALDGTNVLSLNPSQALGPGVLGITFVVTSDVAGEEFPPGSGRHTEFVGQIVDADILFNANENLAVPSALGASECLDASGNNICYDLQSIAAHEIGHLFGLSHSAIWGALMWPFAPPAGNFQRALLADDQAGIASLYATASFASAAGQIAGRVVNAFGQPVFGAHVVAVNTTTGASVVGTVAAGRCVNGQYVYDGSYLVEGLDPGGYFVYAEPLDGPTSPGDLGAFFGGLILRPAVDTGFTTRPR